MEHSESIDFLDESSSDSSYTALLQHLSETEQLEKLKINFGQRSLNKTEFYDAINNKNPQQIFQLFNEITNHEDKTVNWNEFLDFIIEANKPKLDVFKKLVLAVPAIETIPHAKRETIVKIVPIETSKHFCYAILSKHGRIGLYDGNLNFLTSYHVIMTREDMTRTEEERRRRNRWITDAVFCGDTLMFIVTNSARSLMIYEASGLKHVPYFLILSTPNIIECLTYKPYNPSENNSESCLYMGDSTGQIISLHFLQPKLGLMRKKHNDRMSLFYWIELPFEKQYILVKYHKKIHENSLEQLEYISETDSIVSSSRDSKTSVIQNLKKGPQIFRMPRGCTAFSWSIPLKLLITGSDDGSLRLWNCLIASSKPIAVLHGHKSGVIDVKILGHQEVFLSFSRDAVLKLWSVETHKCLQTIKVNFPCFGVQGKTVEWGRNSIYPGPKRFDFQDQEKPSEHFGDAFEDLSQKELSFPMQHSKTKQDPWQRSNILITCCNYIAKIPMGFPGNEILEASFERSVLAPPPLQNSVLIPSTWKIPSGTRVGVAAPTVSDKDKMLALDELRFVLDKDFLQEHGLNSDINYKIAKLESKKMQMRSYIAEGAPYLALDLFDIEELKLSDDLPVPSKKKIRKLVEKTKEMIVDARMRDQVFSEPSSSRSRSSKSSVVEFNF